MRLKHIEYSESESDSTFARFNVLREPRRGFQVAMKEILNRKPEYKRFNPKIKDGMLVVLSMPKIVDDVDELIGQVQLELDNAQRITDAQDVERDQEKRDSIAKFKRDNSL